MEEMLKSLKLCKTKIQVITVCGHNKKAYENINELRKSLNYPVVVIGFTDKVAELMSVSDLMVTKAGGISVTEAMNMRLPMVLFASIPGQETWNEELLTENGAAIKAASVGDLPGIVDVACDLISGAGLQDRVSCVRGDYHVAELPSGFDTVNIFGVLHQEEPDSIRDILSRSFAALNPGGVIHVLDMMTDATHCQPPFSALFAVNMALTTENGWVFSDVELKAWMEESGYVDFTCRPLPPPMPHWLASARKPA